MREWNWTAAEKEDKRAVALNGSSPFCHLCYAELLRVIGRNNEALDQIYQAKSLDPHSRIINVRLIHYLVCARRFNDALAQIDEAVAMEAVRDMDLSGDRRDIFLALGQTDKAIESERDGRIADGESREKVEQDAADEKRAAPVEGAKVIWRPRLEWDKKQNNSYALYDQACCYAQLGEADEAFTCLDRLLKEHNTVLTFAIMTDWMLDPLRSDPRFHAILKTMHFE
jgi:tetratricopeptide (TPR) repeat protein